MWLTIIKFLVPITMITVFVVVIIGYIKCEKSSRELERKWREEEKFRRWLVEQSLIEENGPLTTYCIEADTAGIKKDKKRRRYSIS